MIDWLFRQVQRPDPLGHPDNLYRGRGDQGGSQVTSLATALPKVYRNAHAKIDMDILHRILLKVTTKNYQFFIIC